MKKISRFSVFGWLVLGAWLLFCGMSSGQNVPAPILNFDGVVSGPENGVPYPDVNGAVGATEYVQFQNAIGSATGSQTTGNFAVWNKTTGALMFGPYDTNVLWKGFTGPCSSLPSSQTLVLYDQQASVWVVARHVYPDDSNTILCLAISQTSDFTAHTKAGVPEFYHYSYLLTSLCPTCADNDEMDSPRLGIWPDAYYMSFNLLANAAPHGFINSLVCAFDRNSMIAGSATPATPVCFMPPNTYESLSPTDLDGPTAPPTGSPNYFMNLGAGELHVWQFHVDFASPSDSTFTGPSTVAIPPYNDACAARGGICIPQSSSPPPGCTPQPNCYPPSLLEAFGDRLMYRLSYRNFGTHESILATHSVNPQSTGAYSSSRWYEIRTPETPTLYQWGEFDPDNTSRWMGSIAQDDVGDIAIGYSASSLSEYPSILYTGRLVTDPLGTLETEVNVISGGGNQVFNTNWGGYTSMSIDPVNDCTFWFTNAYYPDQASKIWHTRIASFQFPNCN
jgi:hypothetical protein